MCAVIHPLINSFIQQTLIKPYSVLGSALCPAAIEVNQTQDSCPCAYILLVETDNKKQIHVQFPEVMSAMEENYSRIKRWRGRLVAEVGDSTGPSEE